MSHLRKRLIAPDWRPGQAAAAGLIATAIYSIAMKVDQRLTHNHFDDVTFIQGLLGDPQATSRRFSFLAWVLHFLNGALLAEVYAALVKRYLPGPDWLKGALFGEVFILAAWPLTPLVDRSHPMVKNGRLPRLATPQTFWQNIVRHLTFGLALGLLYRKSSR